MEKQTRKRIIWYCVLFTILAAGLTIILFPYFRRFAQPEYQSEIQNRISKMGIWGPLAILGLQILQIIVAFIPGEPVEILAGALYGAGGGLAICLLGSIAASTAIFRMSKRFGKQILFFLFGKRKAENWKWLQDSRKSNFVTFILFFIPGTSKDMLTYIVGITEMNTTTFILISTFARIPSVLSSAIIGATMRQGSWKISLIVFFITGTIGIVGIGVQDRLVSFCRKYTKRSVDETTDCECLDFVEASHRKRVYPLMYFHMNISGHLDLDRLKQSVTLSSKVVPEILYAYDFHKNRFVSLGYTADDVIQYDAEQSGRFLRVDLSSRPQLQIVITPKENYSFVMIVMSHILSDGEGFLQYLYLLAALYNGKNPDHKIRNLRGISPLLENIHVLAPTQQTKYHRHISIPPLRSKENGSRMLCLTSRIPADRMTLIHQKATKLGATMNDVFMTAYARVIARMKNINTMVLPCPASLRKFRSGSDDLTVANMTGIYRKVVIEIPPGCSFTSTLQQVHLEMQLQKSLNRCFAGIKALNETFHKVPRPLLGQVIKATYRLRSVSYTNWGMIDHEKLCFKDCTIQNCFFTGTYRLAPDFQLTISTFQNICTLNCTLLGSDDNKRAGQYILESVKQELLDWIA